MFFEPRANTSQGELKERVQKHNDLAKKKAWSDGLLQRVEEKKEKPIQESARLQLLMAQRQIFMKTNLRLRNMSWHQLMNIPLMLWGKEIVRYSLCLAAALNLVMTPHLRTRERLRRTKLCPWKWIRRRNSHLLMMVKMVKTKQSCFT